ncbi:MAG: four helix bundle protein [Planctomycetales bacterium]|nr:four helix bundle protein [Planctomycetales bacterium]
MQDFRRLQVWTKAHELALEIYKITEQFPQSELYGLTSQIRRAAVSIASNIAEGAGRSTEVEFARFIEIAGGSASEVEYQLLLARDLHYLEANKCATLDGLVNEVKKMLYALSNTLRNKARATNR